MRKQRILSLFPLPKTNSRVEKFKKFVLLLSSGMALAQITAIPFYCGAALGYLSARYFSGRSTAQQGKIKSLSFNAGSYRVHLHHWTLSGLLIVPLLVKGLYLLEFFSGVCGFYAALIFHGIYSYTDWHKIISRKPEID